MPCVAAYKSHPLLRSIDITLIMSASNTAFQQFHQKVTRHEKKKEFLEVLLRVQLPSNTVDGPV
jgi:hypothetical protein